MRILIYSHLLFLLVLASGGCQSRGAPESENDGSPESQENRVLFSEVAEASGLGEFRHVTGAFGEKFFPETMGSGAAFLDYNGDGWQDVLLAGGGAWEESGDSPQYALWLFKNEGEGSFTLVSDEAGLGDIDAYSIGIAVADYDNDGDQDFYLTTLEENLLFRNDNGVFAEVARRAGVNGEPVWSSSPIFFDADRDGHVDLYVGNYVEWSPESDIFCSLDGETKGYCTPENYPGIPSRYYHNDGDGTFTDRTEEAGFLPAPGKTLGVTELDFNRDGWPDLMVANDTERDLLYENNSDGTFDEIGALSGVAYDENGKARAGMGIDAGVVDETGHVTVFVGNFSKEMIGVYRHDREGLFSDRAAVSKIGRPSLMTLTFGLFLFDVDLDDDLDLFAANGHVQSDIESTQEGITYEEAPHLFINRGDGTFHDVVPDVAGALAQRAVSRGAAFADYDRDGDLDILITENGGSVILLRNELMERAGTPPHFLRLTLEGTDSNRDGISARIRTHSNGTVQERRVRTGSSYLSQSELTATFGLGTTEDVDSVVVEWPSGKTDRFKGVLGNVEYHVVEGRGSLEIMPMQTHSDTLSNQLTTRTTTSAR